MTTLFSHKVEVFQRTQLLVIKVSFDPKKNKNKKYIIKNYIIMKKLIELLKRIYKCHKEEILLLIKEIFVKIVEKIKNKKNTKKDK